MKSPLNILLWKEWRETRINLLFCIVFLLLFKILQIYLRKYQTDYEKLFSVNIGYALISIIFCCVYGMILGAGMFALEYNQRTLPYLFTHPISRKSILLSKWIIGVGQLIGLGLIAWFFSLIGYQTPADYPQWHATEYFRAFVLLSVPLFIISSFWSVLLKDMTKATVISVISIPLGIAILLLLRSKLLVPIKTGYAYYNNSHALSPLLNIPDIIIVIPIIFIGIFSIFLFLRQEMK